VISGLYREPRSTKMSRSNTAYQKAQELAAASKNEAALLAFEEAFKQEPTNFRAVFGVGLMLQRLQQHADAVVALSQVISMQPRIAEAFYSRALSPANGAVLHSTY